ncbi:hypothetical protein [Paraburkholderia oxyphila]|uniref:hypothetical protein n=1 Tax=Paraburkholderia oxyphila TaxID=614212 RepID=UPI0005B8A253|nr:hypothetical protein [Paraburkholderia oxyphila]
MADVVMVMVMVMGVGFAMIVAACVPVIIVMLVPMIVTVGMLMVAPFVMLMTAPVLIGTGVRTTARAILVCVRMRAAAGVIVLRFIERDGRFRRARRRSIPPFVARPKALREHKPRPESLDHGRFLPKVTESLDSL